MNRAHVLRKVRGAGLALAAAGALLGPATGRAACDTSICVGGASACSISGIHQIDNLCTLDFGTKTVTVNKGARLENDSSGSFTILAGELIVRGELEALRGGVTIDVDDEFKTEIVANSAGRLDFREGGTIDVTAGGAVSIAGKDFDTSGTGGTDGGDIDIVADGCVTIDRTVDASGGGDFAFGGFVFIDADCITTNALIKSIGTQEGDGGDVDLFATNAITLNGNINTNGSGEFAFGGYITVDAGTSVSVSGDFNANGGSEGVGGDIDVSADTTLTTTSSSQMTCTAGGGGDGCFAILSAVGDVALSGDVDAGAGGADAFGGDIDVSSSNGDVTVASSSTLTVDTGSSGFVDGDISLFVCDVEVDGVLDSRGGPKDGTNTVTYREIFDGTSATLRAGDNGNVLRCRCVDTSPADGVCDTPAACVNDPMTSGGSYNPSPTTSPVILAACN